MFSKKAWLCCDIWKAKGGDSDDSDTIEYVRADVKDAYHILLETGFGRLQDDYRDLMRAAHAFCVSELTIADMHDNRKIKSQQDDDPEWADLWELCKDYKEEEDED